MTSDDRGPQQREPKARPFRKRKLGGLAVGASLLVASPASAAITCDGDSAGPQPPVVKKKARLTLPHPKFQRHRHHHTRHKLHKKRHHHHKKHHRKHRKAHRLARRVNPSGTAACRIGTGWESLQAVLAAKRENARNPALPTPSAAIRKASRTIETPSRKLPEPEFGNPPNKLPFASGPAAIKSAATSSVLAPSSTAFSAPQRVDGGPVSPGGRTGAVITDDDELILEISTPKGELNDTLIAYGLRQGVYVPFGALARFLDLPISVSDEGHYANGWFLNEKRNVAINLRQGSLVVEGRELPLSRDDAIAYQGELYIKADRIAAILPLSLDVDLRAQTLVVRTKEPFPFELRQEREAQRERLGNRRSAAAPRFPREQTPWSALSFPLADAEMRVVSDTGLGTRGETDLRLSGDLAFLTARAFVSSSTRDGITAARLEMGRRDPDANLLGPLRATEFQLGDIATTSLPIGLRGIGGRGAFISNAPLEQASIFDVVDLRGDLPDGYEVELYRNGTLIGSTRNAVNGQYEFLRVPVDFGLNLFRFVFYGPQGQRREAVRRISVGDGRLSPGEFRYSAGLAQKDVNLFGVHGPGFSPSPDYAAWRGSASLEYGISRAVTASLAGAIFTSGGRQRWLASAGLRTGLGAIAAKLDLAAQDQGGRAIEAGVGGKIFGMSFALNHAEYSGNAIDEVRAVSGEALRRATEFDLNTSIRLGSGTHAASLPINGRLTRIAFADGRVQTAASVRTSLPMRGILLSNTLDYLSGSAPGTPTTRLFNGAFDLSTLSGSRMTYRAVLDYGIVPEPRLISASVEADRRIGDMGLVRASVTHALIEHQTSFGLSAVRRFGPMSLAVDGDYTTPSKTYSVTLRLGFGFGRNPLTGAMFLDRPGLANGGAVALRAFRDANANGRFDVGEPVIPEVMFGAGALQATTRADGIALLGGIGDGTRASIAVDKDSLPDIDMAPLRPGIEIVPRSGRIHTSEFAIRTLSDAEGTVYFAREGAKRPVSGVTLRLIGSDGSVVAHTRTQSDGFYLFERLPAGEYRVELDPDQARNLKIRLDEDVSLQLGGDSGVTRRAITIVPVGE